MEYLTNLVGVFDIILQRQNENKHLTTMTKYRLKKTKTEESIVNAYKRMEGSIVKGYQAIEDTMVGTYQKIEDKFVEAFLVKENEDENENK